MKKSYWVFIFLNNLGTQTIKDPRVKKLCIARSRTEEFPFMSIKIQMEEKFELNSGIPFLVFLENLSNIIEISEEDYELINRNASGLQFVEE